MVAEPAAFGAELRRLRERAGMSLAGLADRVHYSKGHLSKVESGHKPPSAELARLCDTAVGAGGALLRLVTAPGRAAPVAGPEAAEGQEGWLLGVTPDGSGYFVPGDDGVPRHAALGTTFGTSRRSADTTVVVAAFRERFGSVRGLGQVAGPAVVLPAVIADAQTLRGLAAGAAPGDRPSVWQLAARYAEFAGWMTQEAGDDRMAVWWTAAAVRMALLGGDHTLEAYALVRRADIALHKDDALGTIDLARRAQRYDRIPARIRGLAAQREAQGHALTGDYDACLRALDRSAELLAAAADHDGPALGSTNTPEESLLAGGWCFYDLGRPGEAAEILDRGIGGFAPGAHRARARYVTRAALAYGSAGELERACELMSGVLEQVLLLDSATIRHDLRQLARVLARWHNHPGARDLRRRLADVLRVE